MTRTNQSARTKARKRALDVLFESEIRQVSPLLTLEERIEAAQPPIREFTVTLVKGVYDNLDAIDDRLCEALSEGWALSRMPRVDRNLARIAIYEIVFTDIAPAIAIDEAVQLSAQLSTDDSPGFLNGLLGVISTTTAESR